jgi:hypothetical protein
MSQARLKKLKEEIKKIEKQIDDNSMIHNSLLGDIERKLEGTFGQFGGDDEPSDPIPVSKAEYAEAKKVQDKINSDIEKIKTKTQQILKIKRDEENIKNNKVFYQKLIEAVPQQKVVVKNVSIKVPKQEENPALNKATKRLEALRKKPKTIIVKTLIKEQEFIIKKLREVARIANLRKKIK